MLAIGLAAVLDMVIGVIVVVVLLYHTTAVSASVWWELGRRVQVMHAGAGQELYA